ncbi:MAG: hypothetical protein QMA98_01895 [Pseudomonadales bacterium]|jgi:hypothetical protein|tara:strand:+ start:161 stop:349 length:189 start_codon:yes stop_codon:yes gene_type:complete
MMRVREAISVCVFNAGLNTVRPKHRDMMRVIAELTNLDRIQQMLDYIEAQPPRRNLASATQS